jgi:hypothetical protein
MEFAVAKAKTQIEAVAETTLQPYYLINIATGKTAMAGMLTTKRIRYKSIIASVSFGAERTFQLKHNTIKDLKKSIVLQHGYY